MNDYAAKADAMRQLAASASRESTRDLYLKLAKTWDDLDRKRSGSAASAPDAAIAPPVSVTADTEMQLRALRGRVRALEHALVATVALLKQVSPAMADAFGRIRIEPDPNAPADEVDEAKRTVQ